MIYRRIDDINDAFVIYKRIDDEINACEIEPSRYTGYKLTNEKKRKIFQELIDAKIDIEKFFLANCTLNKKFFVDYYPHSRDKCMTLYHSWDEFLEKKRPSYFRRVIKEYKKGTKVNFNDRDSFLELISFTDPLFFSALYANNPHEMLDLLLSISDDWIKFNLPECASLMDYVRKVTRGYFVLKNMKSFSKLQEKLKRSVV